MNPELQRNLWLELTPQRLVLMTGGLALAFFAAALPGGLEYGPSAIARWLFIFIVVVFGTRNAALAVVGEIRDRTWDWQRLSALGPAAMMWGKLLGSTIYAWYGGILCLAVIVAGIGVHQGPAVAAIEAIYYLALGAIAQASALLASLIAIRRRQSASRLGAFVYQATGLVAAVAVALVWSTADPAGILRSNNHIDVVFWWGQAIDARPFLLLSLGLFTGWIVLACYREMRLELQLTNGPFVWLAFLAFMGIYVAGFDAWLPRTAFVHGLTNVGLRLAVAGGTYIVLTYAMVLLEPKDRVLYRWLLSRFREGRIVSALASLQSWMMSYDAALLVAAALGIWIWRTIPAPLAKEALVAAALGFLTRDVSIFVLAQTFAGKRRSDLGALVILIAAYLLLPAIVSGLKLSSLLFVFYPVPSTPVWLSPAVAWSEALVLAVLAVGRVSLADRPAEGPS